MLTKPERNKIKKQIGKALTDKAHGIFDKKEGYALYNGTNLEMVMLCVFEGLNEITDKDARTAEALREELNEADERHFNEVAELELKVRDLESRLKMRGCN